jgi:hypothetical protein
MQEAKRHSSCFCWAALTPHLGPKLTKSRRSLASLPPFCICLCSEPSFSLQSPWIPDTELITSSWQGTNYHQQQSLLRMDHLPGDNDSGLQLQTSQKKDWDNDQPDLTCDWDCLTSVPVSLSPVLCLLKSTAHVWTLKMAECSLCLFPQCVPSPVTNLRPLPSPCLLIWRLGTVTGPDTWNPQA